MDSSISLRSLSQHFAKTTPLSRTPSRRQQPKDEEINAFLPNLSPSSTLGALLATDAVPTEKSQRRSLIKDGIASASTSERAWGIKAALTGKKLREWHLEILGWSWPGYDMEGLEEEQYRRNGLLAQQYEERLGIIRDDMETLEVDGLKNYVRSTHLGSHSRKLSAPIDSIEYRRISDFETIITATIIQALPVLSQLTSLIDLWTMRLIIIRQVPAFLRTLADGQESMISAWMAVADPNHLTAKWKELFSQQSFLDIQAVLKDQIAQLGRGLDNMLDLLEGSQDTLPEQWIDAMDCLENEYSLWVVKAEELVLHSEMTHRSRSDQKMYRQENGTTAQTEATETGTSWSDAALKTQSGDFARTMDTNSGEMHAHSNPEPAAYKLGSDSELLVNVEPGPCNFPKPSSNLAADPDGQVSKSLHGTRNDPKSAQCQTSLKLSESTRRPAPLVLSYRVPSAGGTISSNLSTGTSDPGSATSDYFSDKSSPEIRSASVIEYVSSPTLVNSPRSSGEAVATIDHTSQRASLQTQRSIESPYTEGFLASQSRRGRASSHDTKATVSADSETIEGQFEALAFATNNGRTRSASMQSIEVVRKNEIRKIMVRRSGSYTAASSEIQNVKAETDPSIIKLSQKGTESPRKSSMSMDRHLQDLLPREEPSNYFHGDLDALKVQPTPSEKPPIPPRSPHRFQQTSSLDAGYTPVKVRRKITDAGISDNVCASEVKAQTPAKVQSMNPDDRIEAKISDILTNLPTHIRLTSGLEPHTPEATQSGGVSKDLARRPLAMQLIRAQTSVTHPTMTLAPAQIKSSPSRFPNSEPVIKLYHLHQPGKDVPIKLFVRLVGETGERVMVRIGGGWADLAEYLKEYASHHGRRSVSDTRFDIYGISSSPTSPAMSSSRPTSPTSPRSRLAKVFKRQQTTPGKFESPHTPVSERSVRSLSRMSWTEEESPSLGLAGPKTKNVEISPGRQAWVEQAIEQARAENGGTTIGNMGKVGGTKRVFLKGRTRAASNI